MAGMLGVAAVLRLFFSPRGFEAAGLEKGVGDHRHQSMSMYPGP